MYSWLPLQVRLEVSINLHACPIANLQLTVLVTVQCRCECAGMKNKTNLISPLQFVIKRFNDHKYMYVFARASLWLLIRISMPRRLCNTLILLKAIAVNQELAMRAARCIWTTRLINSARGACCKTYMP